MPAEILLFKTFEFVLTVCVVLFSVVLHEYAHGRVAYHFGDPTAKAMGRLTLNPLKHIDFFGMLVFPLLLRFLGLPPLGWAKPVPVNFANLRNPKLDMIWVAAAGPGTNLLLAFLAAQLLPVVQDFLANVVLQYFFVVNLALAAFNLIPIPPLDGGRIVAGILPRQWEQQYSRLEPVGLIIIILLLNFGYLDFIGNVINFLAKIFLKVAIAF